MAEEKEKKDSYTKLFNPILEALCKGNFTGREFRIIFFIIRCTYGWNKTRFPMSASYISEGTGIDKRKVGTILKKLVSRNVIIDFGVDEKSRSKVYGLNKRYSQWDRPMSAENGVPENGVVCPPKMTPMSAENEQNDTPVDGGQKIQLSFKRQSKKEKEKKCSQNSLFFNPETETWEIQKGKEQET